MPPSQSTHLSVGPVSSIFPLISISNCRICPPTFPGCGSLGLWLHPHHVHKLCKRKIRKKIEMEMEMKMSNDWWNMQRVRHPTTSKLPLHRRVCHNFSWGCGEKEKKYWRVFCFIFYFWYFVFLWKWNFSSLVIAAGPGPVNQPSRSRSELPTSNYASNWMLCLTLMMTLMNKQTKQTASATCESTPCLPCPSPYTHQQHCSICFVSISISISISISVSVCVSAVSLGHLTTMSVNGQMKVFGVGAMKRGAMWCGDCGCHS